MSGRRVFFSIGRHRRVPRRYRGRDVFWWRRALGDLDQTTAATPAVRRMPPPLVTGVRGGHDVDIRQYTAQGMTLLGHVLSIRDGRVALAPDLESNLKTGDRTLVDFKRAVDDFITMSGIEAPPAQDAAESNPVSALPGTSDEIDVRAAGIGSVIWATGYAFEFGWVELPIFDAVGTPIHRRGVTAAPGIYLLGLAWLHKSKSSFLYGVGEDAEYLAEHIAGQCA